LGLERVARVSREKTLEDWESTRRRRLCEVVVQDERRQLRRRWPPSSPAFTVAYARDPGLGVVLCGRWWLGEGRGVEGI